MWRISSSKSSGSVKMSRATRKMPFAASSSIALSTVVCTVSSMDGLLSFLVGVGGGQGRGEATERAEDAGGAAAALGAAAAAGVDLAGPAGPVAYGLFDLRVADRIAEAEIHSRLLSRHACGGAAWRGPRRVAVMGRFGSVPGTTPWSSVS